MFGERIFLIVVMAIIVAPITVFANFGTKEALNKDARKYSDTENRMMMPLGMEEDFRLKKSQKVRDVQEALNQEGFNINVDGAFGPETRQAIRQYQAKNNLKQTGNFNRETLDSLDINFTDSDFDRMPASVKDK